MKPPKVDAVSVIEAPRFVRPCLGASWAQEEDPLSAIEVLVLLCRLPFLKAK